jgi:hypothetical protein
MGAIEYTRLARVDVIDEGVHVLLVVVLSADNSFKMQTVLLAYFVVYCDGLAPDEASGNA